jgi:hypothetical protein
MSRNTIFIGSISSQKGGESTPVGDRNIISVTNPAGQNIDYGRLFENITTLPTTVLCGLTGNTSANIPVTWAEGSYDETVAGPYTLVGTLGTVSGITNTTGITAAIVLTVVADFEFDVYVANDGDDSNDGLSPTTPLETLPAAVVLAVSLGGSRTIKLADGTYTLIDELAVPPSISIIGSGLDTYITGDASLNYTADIDVAGWEELSRFLIQVSSVTATSGSQTFKDFVLDGSEKANHGGMLINKRNSVTLNAVTFTGFNVSGLWAIDTDGLQILNCSGVDNATVTTANGTGNFMFGSNTNTTIDNTRINEGLGFGIKVYDPTVTNPIVTNFKILHNSSISVTPNTLLGGNNANNRAISIDGCYLVGFEIADSYIDNVIRLYPPVAMASNYSSGVNTVKIHHNTLDLSTRAVNKGLPIECGFHNIQVYDNFMEWGAGAAIGNLSSTFSGQAARNNWLIYNNVFSDQNAFTATGIVRSTYTPLTNLQFYNNTVRITNDSSVHIIMTENGMVNFNWSLKNNIILDESTTDASLPAGGPNSLVNLVGGGSVANLAVTHNIIFGMPVGSIVGGTYSNNITTNPQLTLVGVRPDPYYRPLPSSPAILAGTNVGIPFTGASPTIGRFEPLTFDVEVEVTDVEDFDDVQVFTGVAFADLLLALPTTAEITLTTSAVEDAVITWAQGSYDEDVEAIYALTGTLTLPSGITNPEGYTAAINVVVTSEVEIFNDTFDRVDTTPGADYTVVGASVTTVLNGSNMQIDGLDGNAGQRILLDLPLTGLNDIEVIMEIQVVEQHATSYGLGLGIQNQVNPDPNKGVFSSFYMSSAADQGTLQTLSGNGTIDDLTFGSFSVRDTSDTQVPVATSNIYEYRFRRQLSGSNLVFTSIIRNTVTNASTTSTWTETGGGSLIYEGTSSIAIYHFGGLQQINSIIVRDLTESTTFPNVVSVASVTPFSVANGTAFGANGVTVGLPQTLAVVLSDGATPTYPIVWAQGSYSPTTAAVYNLVGTITIPSDVTNSPLITATAAVTVASPTTAVTFNYYVNWDTGNDTTGVGSAGNPWKTISKAATVLTAGQTLGIRGSLSEASPMIYRETVVPTNSGTTTNRITYAMYPGEYAEVCGLEILPNTGWTVDSGNVYKKTVTPPANGHGTSLTSNTTILSNQLFRNGSMMFEARWPKITSEAGLLESSNMRHHTQGTTTHTRGFNYDRVIDTAISASTGSGGIGATAGTGANSLVGAKLIVFGWFNNHPCTITSHPANNEIRYSPTVGSNDSASSDGLGCRYRKYWYVQGKRNLLTTEKEWHWDQDTNTLYFWQPGGGTITGTVEYKTRNWGFDLRGKSNITIAGLRFRGCEPATDVKGTAANNIIIDNIRATYTNHALMFTHSHPGYGNAMQTGIQLRGSNNVVKNSEFQYAAAAGVWFGPGGTMDNCWWSDINYEGGWGAPIHGWPNAGDITVTNNTFTRTGRSNIDIGHGPIGPSPKSFALNWEIAYNDCSGWGKINNDLGATYSWGYRDLTGLELHHNWFHAPGIVPDPNPAVPIDGGSRSVYFDQATGGGIRVYRNVFFDAWENIPQNASDFYNQMTFEGISWGTALVANNTFASESGQNISTTTYESLKDRFRNNIFWGRLNEDWGRAGAPNEQGNVFRPNPHHVVNASGTQFGLHSSSVRGVNPLFVSSGSSNGLDYQIQSGSPARNRAVAVSEIGVAAGDDAGAYEYGVTPWEPGYEEVPYFIPDEEVGPVNITAITTTVNDFSVPYNTAFGTNGVTVGLPQTVTVTYSDASSGSVGITWTGSYSPTAGPWDDIVYTITGTPVLVGDVTNSPLQTLSVDITVTDMLAPVEAVATIAVVRDTIGLVNGVTNDYGTVTGGVATQWDNFYGPSTTDYIQSGTGPTLTAGRLVFTQKLTTALNTDLDFLHYQATAANLKSIILKAIKITDVNDLNLIFGNNGFYEGNAGISYGSYTTDSSATIQMKITGGGANQIVASHLNLFTPGTEFLWTARLDNTLLPAAGKSKMYNGTTLVSATSTGTGVLSGVALTKPVDTAGGASATYNFEGSLGPEIIINGSVSDGILLKLQQDLMAYCGI